MPRLTFRVALAAALPLFAAAAAAQPAPRVLPDVPARIAALAPRLALTPDQQARLDGVAARYAGQTDAAALWAAAADVQALLTDAQTTALAERRAGRREGARDGARAGRRGESGNARRTAPRPGRAGSEARREAAGTSDEQPAADRRVRHEAAQAARVRVLGLTAEQQTALSTLAAERVRSEPGAPDAARRAGREALRARAETILTPRQRAIQAVHSALAHAGRAGHGRRGDGPRGERRAPAPMAE